ncbi:putative rrna-processing protein efg1 protein [Botrytis fragariae]|uniref:rRNA-processing protein EFG1 n=1 Tax=Botrytis fragariae TaxID=1964551 RepID=A0A8H6EIM3_9HELO|nr:putative rrna-processing protein efg1 protein [Botrytis fragariae]KAF5873601.1 putative rrna-processing protein efg1 protein [Botrytis fragariae]
MAPKRKLSESDAAEVVHPSRQVQVYGDEPKPAKKRKSEPAFNKKQAHASSVNTIKKKIRDITRKLERAQDLPADVRVEDERALAAYQQELASAEAEKIRQKMIKKYHMVRFFERQKATRQLKKLRKRLLESESTEEVEQLKDEMHILEVDLNYTQYHPLSETYISLYPPKGSGEDTEDKATKEKPPMWKEVEKCMEEGTLDRLRNRKPDVTVSTTKPVRLPERKLVKPKSIPQPKPVVQAPAIDTTGMNRRQRRAQRGVKDTRATKIAKNKSTGFSKNQAFGAVEGARADEAQDGNVSDGGFFEE